MRKTSARVIAQPVRSFQPWQLGAAAGLIALTTISAVPLEASAAPTGSWRPGASATALGQQMESAIEDASPGSQAGIDVIDTATGAVIADLDADQQFYTASVVKLLIALDKLNSQGWQADSDTAAQLDRMLSVSDDEIADQLWGSNGGDAIVSRMVGLIGLTGTTPPGDSSQWGETRTTAQDVVSIYRYITTVLPGPARELIMSGLRNAAQIAADGTDQYFGIPDGLPGSPRAIKQGWMMLNDSTTMDTTGLVGAGPGQPLRYAVVVLTSQPAGISWDTAGSAVTAGIGVLHNALDAPALPAVSRPH
ncbi:hypothetical protein ACIP5Y_37405 [Nocardia sp. NPDC088792]|uniref:hypothetical protein n=1 Tax=Nocardia sp. NPDC088792 TaxID=3364332 RepID=UPI0038177F00